jgi:hypothetical protein
LKDLRLLNPGLRRMLFVASWLVFLAGIQTFVLTEQTDRYFAWTAAPPLTAAFLGAAYWASSLLEFLAARQRFWVQARPSVPAVLLFTLLTLALTLLNLGSLHLGPAYPPLTVGLTWAWIVVYAAAPVAFAVLLTRQLSRPGNDPARLAPFSGWLRGIIVGQGVIFLLSGLALLVAAPATLAFWPWPLTAFTGRAIGAWLVALGVIAAQTVWDADYVRARVVMASTVAFGMLELLALARYSSEIDWRHPIAWAYLAFLVSVLLVGLYGWRKCQSAGRGVL